MEQKPTKFAALIVAAGAGQRAGGGTPKQYRDLGGEAVLTRTLRAFLDHAACNAVQVVIQPQDLAHYTAATVSIADNRLKSHAFGAETRAASVRAGLEALAGLAPEAVLVHDAARPFVTADVIDRVHTAIAPDRGAFPALPVVDALWQSAEGVVSRAQARADLWRAQTPQGFPFGPILSAHRAATGPAADDVAVARAAGLEVRVVPGDDNNFKITVPEDFHRAERLLRVGMDIRSGNGFDVHAFGSGDHLVLCGVRIPFDRGLSGHSDADVAMHALTDAILGALAEGDIGQWFPPDDPQWKGADSRIFLEKAMERAAARGFSVSNMDCTIICEAPRIGPHAPAMRDRLAAITGIAPDRISVKATTSERLGFTGRGEGVAALATAMLVST